MGCSNSKVKDSKIQNMENKNVDMVNPYIMYGVPQQIEEEKKPVEQPKTVLKLSNPNQVITNNIWIDPTIDSQKNAAEIKSKLNSLKIKLFTNINSSINYLKTIKSTKVKVIINHQIYPEFIQKYKENIVDMCFHLTIIIFKNEEEDDKEDNINYKTDEQIFYEMGGIVSKLEELKKLLDKESNKIQTETKKKNLFDNEVQLTFEFIDSKEQLLLPLSFKSLIEKTSNDNMLQYTNTLFKTYSEETIEIKRLLDSFIYIPKMTVGTLAKYYAKFYSIESGFYKDLNASLRLNKAEKYLPFIKTLYEGVKVKMLPLASDSILYRGQLISKFEIDKIKNFLNNKVENLPGLIVFCKPFLSFSKDREVAENFLSMSSCYNNLTKVLFTLEKDDNVGFNLSTHCDLENISYYQSEKEVLFFPFSSFEIKEIKEIDLGYEKIYEMRLLYLGKYLKDIENDKNITINENSLPDSEFKKQLIECGLIQKEKIEKINPQSLLQNFKKFENDIKNNKNADEVVIINKNIINSNKSNIITGEIYINSENVNKDILIINSFENFQRINNKELNNENDAKNLNENEIKENTEIKINGNKIEFSYTYKFESEGIYTIEYFIKKNLTRINHMFSDCEYLTKLNLSNLNTQDVENMSYMFYNCKSLTDLDVSNFDTQNVSNISYMFYNCNSLKNLNLSDFKINKGTEVKNIFAYCDSLMDLIAPFKYH